jgi:ribosomal protein S18 acetylase RimI-like enzyme
VLEHSEHALILQGAPREGPTDPRISLRTATESDTPAIANLMRVAFDGPVVDVMAPRSWPSERVLLVEMEGRPVGTVRLTHDDEGGGVYGFAIDPAWQGRGLGKDVLRRVCRQLREEGAHQVHLEVAVGNDRALGLYTSIGFTPVSTEDYYRLPFD